MNNATRRFRLLVVLAPLIALALGSFWLMEVMRRSADEVIPSGKRTEPDFYVEKFSYVRMSKEGQPQYHVAGAKLVHNPETDSYEVEQPRINSLDKKRSPIMLSAEHALINSDNSEIQMQRNVNLDRPATSGSEHLHVKSEYMLLLPDDDIVKTDKPVAIALGQSTLTGTGMYVNNATREFRLTSNVHGTYQPVSR